MGDLSLLTVSAGPADAALAEAARVEATREAMTGSADTSSKESLPPVRDEAAASDEQSGVWQADTTATAEEDSPRQPAVVAQTEDHETQAQNSENAFADLLSENALADPFHDTTEASRGTDTASANEHNAGGGGGSDSHGGAAAAAANSPTATAGAAASPTGAVTPGQDLFNLLNLAQTTSPPAANNGSEAAKASAAQAFAQQGLRFEENLGQFDSSVAFAVHQGGLSAGISTSGAQLVFAGAANDGSQGVSVGMEVVGAKATATLAGQERQAVSINYLRGGGEGSLHDVPSFNQVTEQGVYDGVNLVYHTGSSGQLEYDFVVSPGASAGEVTLAFNGGGQTEITPSGGLVVHTPNGDVTQNQPVAYQEIDGVLHEVASSFVLKENNEVGFELGSYDHSRPVVIDPQYVYSTYLGGPGFDKANGIAVDPSSGVAYITGTAGSSGLGTATPTRLGPAAGDRSKSAYVAKLSADGRSLTYLTFFTVGGQNEAVGTAIALDGNGSAYITGYTNASDFYANNPNAGVKVWQGTKGGGYDAFVAKLKPNGSDCVYCTYLGGGGSDSGYGIALDSQLNAYVVGSTTDPFFNGTALQKLGPCGGQDAFLVRLKADGSSADKLVAMGGASDDAAYGVAVDNSDPAKVYITGYTAPSSTGNNFLKFVTPANTPFRKDPVGGDDAFAVKVNLSGADATYDYATILGGTGDDHGNGIVLDPSDNSVYVVGDTTTSATAGFKKQDNTLFTPGYVDTQRGGTGGGSEAWVMKLDPSGTPIRANFIYIEGSKDDGALGVALQPGTNPLLYVTGYTGSNDGRNLARGQSTQYFPTKNSLQPYGGGVDAFLAVIDPTKTGDAAFLFLTYIGGAGDDKGRSVAVDNAGNAYVAGSTDSKNFRPNARVPGYQLTAGGFGDGFAVKIALNPAGNTRPVLGAMANPSVQAGGWLTFVATATDDDPNDPITYSLFGAPDGANIDPNSGIFNWGPSPSQGPGAYTFFVLASDPNGAYDAQAITVTVTDQTGNPDVGGDTLATAAVVNQITGVKTEIAGAIGDNMYGPADVDLYQVFLSAGQTLTADIDAQFLDDGTHLSNLDSYLRVFDAAGNELAANDNAVDPDTGVYSLDSALTFTAPADGYYYVGVSAAPNGNYNPNVANSGIPGNSTGAYILQLTTQDPLTS